MATTFRCSIVTPTEAVFDDEVIYASFPAWDGQHGVMTGESPRLSRLGYGSLRLDFPEGGSRWYLVEGGFAQVQNGELTLLTDRATPAGRPPLQDGEGGLAEATARVTAATGEDRARVVRDQQRALAKQAMARAVEARGRAI